MRDEASRRVASARRRQTPDGNGDNYPDHLGDVGPGEPTLFDAILDPPIPNDRWTQFALFPLGTLFNYWYDSNRNGAIDVGEVVVSWNNITGILTVIFT